MTMSCQCHGGGFSPRSFTSFLLPRQCQYLQVHLVSIVEAIQDDHKELSLFKEQIPRVAQALIPVWRKRLYLPKVVCLQGD